MFEAYRALRRKGLSIDILPPDTADLSRYKLIVAPGLGHVPPALWSAMRKSGAVLLLGPRTNAKTPQMSIPLPLPPALDGLDWTVDLVESLPPGATVPLAQGGAFRHWFEHLAGSGAPLASTADGRPAVVGDARLRYVAGWPDTEGWTPIVADACREAGIVTVDLSDGLRIRDTATHRFAFNYAPEPQEWEGQVLPPAGVAWQPL
jgi:beta-galactosidase